ncbi:hypothetical protein UT300012_22930 [Paraclostridium bifermentans]
MEEQDLKTQLAFLRENVLGFGKCKNGEELKQAAKTALSTITLMENNPQLSLVQYAEDNEEIIQNLKDRIKSMQEDFEQRVEHLDDEHTKVVEGLKDEIKDYKNTIKLMEEQEHENVVDKVDGVVANAIMDKLTSIEITMSDLLGSVKDVEMVTKKMNLVNNSTGKTVARLLTADSNLIDYVKTYIRKSEKSMEEIITVRQEHTEINSRLNTVNEEYTEITEQYSEISENLENTNDLVDDLQREVTRATEEVSGFKEMIRKISSFFNSGKFRD